MVSEIILFMIEALALACQGQHCALCGGTVRACVFSFFFFFLSLSVVFLAVEY